MRTPKVDQLTLEQLSKKFNTSISDINKTINIAYNKMVHEYVFTHKQDIWDVVMFLKEHFKISEKEAVDKLNEEHMILLTQSAKNKINN